MTPILELNEEQRATVARLEKDLQILKAANDKYDREIFRSLHGSLEAQTRDVDDVAKAVKAAEQVGKLDAEQEQRFKEMDSIQSRLNGVRDAVRNRISDFIVPVAQKAAGVARQTAARIEEEEKLAAEAEGFPFVPSGKVQGLRDRARGFDDLAREPNGKMPYENLGGWLEKQRIS